MIDLEPVTLPDLPKGKEFEEYISAFFQSSGYYIERNIIEREEEEVLELDIIATDYDSTPPKLLLLEAKSGEWGFPEIFKIKGWMVSLNLHSGMIITNKEKRNLNLYIQKAKSLDIDLVVVNRLDKTKDVLSNFINTENINDIDISIIRFSYWLERNLLKLLKSKKKSQSTMKSYSALERYYFELNSGIFFTENIVKKIDKLYSTFQDFPRISAKCGHELIGDPFDSDYLALPKPIYEETFYKCLLNDIQISSFIEHRARLSILKSAIDYVIYKKIGDKEKTDSFLELFGQRFDRKNFLPSSFRNGLNRITNHKYFHRYPCFWQWFMWVFGGFVLKDYEEKEYEILSLKTEIPLDEIPNAFESYQILFPIDNGWFFDLPTSKIKVLKMFPVPFNGIGANYRRLIHTDSQEYNDLKVDGKHTLINLKKWNNLMVEVLKKYS